MDEDTKVIQLRESGIRRLMFKYSVPTIIATVVNAMYNIVDRIFVGRACGAESLAAITVCFAPVLFLLALAMTVGQGSGTLVSIKLGQRDKDAAEKVIGQSIFLFSLFSAMAAALVITFIEPILTFFGATEKILPDACAYYTIIISGLIFEKISFGMNNLIRAEGRPIHAMATILIGGVVNVALDYVFLFEFGWGVRGAAFATVIAQACGSLWVCIYYFGGKSYLKIRLKNIRIFKNLLLSVFHAGSPSLIIQGLAGVAVMLFVRQAGVYGEERAIAVVGVSMTVTTFIFLPVVGLSMGIQPIIGFNLGAMLYDRVRAVFINALIAGTLICFMGFLFAQFIPHMIFMLFSNGESELIPMGSEALRILTYMFPLIGVNIITSGYFQSTKRPFSSIAITVCRQLVFLVPLLYLLPMFFDLKGLWFSYPISDFAAFLVTFYFVCREIRLLNAKIAKKSSELIS